MMMTRVEGLAVCLLEQSKLNWAVNDSPQPVRPVLLFDGECGLCQGVVRFILKRDEQQSIQMAPLQGKTGQALLERVGLPTDDFDSLVLFPDPEKQETMLRTDGVAAVLKLLPGPWRQMGSILAVLPRWFRDGGYRIVAKTRHRIFGDPRPDGLNRPEWAERVLP